MTLSLRFSGLFTPSTHSKAERGLIRGEVAATSGPSWRLLGTVVLASTLGLGGCSDMSRQDRNTATGAVIGGVVGNVLCGGLACTGAGAAVGGVIGHEADKH